MGKLYLNYPMVEAFYHMTEIPDDQYPTRIATLEELKAGQYKARVNHEKRNHNYTKFAVSRDECNVVIRQNLEKGRSLASDTSDIPDCSRILTAQLALLEQEQVVSVLCTCVYYIAEFSKQLLES